jgi:hypothetical protein
VKWNVIDNMRFMTWCKLDDHAVQRRKFNPSDSNDLKELTYFKQNGRWKSSCPFFLEWPYQDIVSMCQERYTNFMLLKPTKSRK